MHPVRLLLLLASLLDAASLRVPVAPALPGYPSTRGLGVLPSFRADAVGCLAAHAAFAREKSLDAVALDMGLLGTFTLLVGAPQVFGASVPSF